MMSTSARRRAITAAAITAALTLGAAGPVHADEPGEHCILLLDDGTTVCAETPEEADAAFTAATGLTRIVDETARGTLGASVVYSLASLHPNNGYGGGGYTITRSFPCDGVTVSGIPDLATVGLNNVVSSFQTFGSCQARLYDGTGYSGSTYGYTTSSTSLGAFNDLASSVRVR